jgi:hypothetical protein
MGQRYENSSLPDQFSLVKPSSPLPNLMGLAKFETAGEACGEFFNYVFVRMGLVCSPLPNL